MKKLIYRLRFIILSLVLAFFISCVSQHKKIDSYSAIKEEPRSKADIINSIYPKLECCACGKSFATCPCGQAKEMKAYIDGLLETGLSEEDVLVRIAKKYSLKVIIDQDTHDKIKQKLIEEAGPERPEIFLEPLFYNFGKVSKEKGKLTLKVKVKNKGRKLLKITNLKTSCACTTVKLKIEKDESLAFGAEGAESGWEVNIAPEKEAELIVIIDLNHPHVKLGKMLRVVEIESNDPVYSSIKVKFEVEIEE